MCTFYPIVSARVCSNALLHRIGEGMPRRDRFKIAGLCRPGSGAQQAGKVEPHPRNGEKRAVGTQIFRGQVFRNKEAGIDGTGNRRQVERDRVSPASAQEEEWARRQDSTLASRKAQRRPFGAARETRALPGAAVRSDLRNGRRPRCRAHGLSRAGRAPPQPFP